jgi:hypothetical protein
MAGIIEALRAAQGGKAIANLGQRHGLDAEQTEQVLAVLVPQLAKGFERNMLDRNGMAQLMQALASGHHAQYADDAAYHASAEAQVDGEQILGHLLGSKTGSRQLAAYGQQETGIPSDVLKQMLPGLATLFMGAVSKQGTQALGAIPGGLGGLEDILRRLPQAGGGGDLGDILRRLPQGGGMGGGGSQGGGLGDIFGEILKRLPQGGGAPQGGGGPSGNTGGGYGIPPLPGGSNPQPQGGGGSGGGGFQIPGFPEVRGDAPGGQMGGPSGGGAWGGGQPPGGSPLPVPGDSGPTGGGWKGNNPYGDIGDIVRGGGQSGGLLATILRSIFGSIIGRSAAPAGRTGGGGWMGWLIKLIVMRYGWRIVTGLFRGILRR